LRKIANVGVEGDGAAACMLNFKLSRI